MRRTMMLVWAVAAVLAATVACNSTRQEQAAEPTPRLTPGEVEVKAEKMWAEKMRADKRVPSTLLCLTSDYNPRTRMWMVVCSFQSQTRTSGLRRQLRVGEADPDADNPIITHYSRWLVNDETGAVRQSEDLE